jgi:hypothetical protein
MIELKAIRPAGGREYPEPLKGMIGVKGHLSEDAVNKFREAIESGSETGVHKILENYPELMRDIMLEVGHHAMWCSNKPQIRPPLTNGKTGKIPDFLLAGRGSGGMKWFIIELKAPSDKLFNQNCTAFSRTANVGLNQLASYLHYAVEKQGAIRDALEIPDFRTPTGILVIGREDETLHDDIKQGAKSFWNDNLSNVDIISYDRILRTAENRLKS